VVRDLAAVDTYRRAFRAHNIDAHNILVLMRTACLSSRHNAVDGRQHDAFKQYEQYEQTLAITLVPLRLPFSSLSLLRNGRRNSRVSRHSLFIS